MAAPQNFRSAFNGFHREDVVNYISYITNKHESDLRDLKNQISALEQERTSLQEQLQLQHDTVQEADSLREQLEQCRKDLADKDRRIAQQEEDIASLLEAPAPKPEPVQPEMPRYSQEELAAYRRAESTERRARERVNRMFDQACGALAGTSANLESTTEKMDALEKILLSNLAEFQQLIVESRTALSDTAVEISSIRPEEG